MFTFEWRCTNSSLLGDAWQRSSQKWDEWSDMWHKAGEWVSTCMENGLHVELRVIEIGAGIDA